MSASNLTTKVFTTWFITTTLREIIQKSDKKMRNWRIGLATPVDLFLRILGRVLAIFLVSEDETGVPLDGRKPAEDFTDSFGSFSENGGPERREERGLFRVNGPVTNIVAVIVSLLMAPGIYRVASQNGNNLRPHRARKFVIFAESVAMARVNRVGKLHLRVPPRY